MSPDLPEDFQQTLARLKSRAGEYDRSGDWPGQDLIDLADAGVMRWAVPGEFGGDGVPPLDLHLRYEAIASASLGTALVLTQRDSAVGMIAGGENRSLAEDFLTRLAKNEFFTTVGVAQLTTSRQGGAPSLLASSTSDGFELNGVIPWSTGADHSKYIIAGAVTETGQQILYALPTELPGVRIEQSMPLVALRSSHTTSITCKGVLIGKEMLIRGPTERALAGRYKGVPIGQAFLALGHSHGAIELIGAHTSLRAQQTREQFSAKLEDLRNRVITYCQTEPPDPIEGSRLRGECNELALRITQAAVALYKGSALLADHPAQRLAREAMFVLVWSCPDPVIDCTVELLRS